VRIATYRGYRGPCPEYEQHRLFGTGEDPNDLGSWLPRKQAIRSTGFWAGEDRNAEILGYCPVPRFDPHRSRRTGEDHNYNRLVAHLIETTGSTGPPGPVRVTTAVSMTRCSGSSLAAPTPPGR